MQAFNSDFEYFPYTVWFQTDSITNWFVVVLKPFFGKQAFVEANRHNGFFSQIQLKLWFVKNYVGKMCRIQFWTYMKHFQVMFNTDLYSKI